MKPPPNQRALPFQSKEQALADMYERIVRIESKLSKLLLHMGLDENGFPRKPDPAKKSPPLTVLEKVN